MLVLNDADLRDIYDELLTLPAVNALLSFFGANPEAVFPYGKDVVTATPGTLLGFCQEVMEWACVYDIAQNSAPRRGDFILRDSAVPESVHEAGLPQGIGAPSP